MPVIADPILTLPEGKDFLNITTTDQDERVTSTIAAASQMIANEIGTVSGSPTRDEWHDGGSDRIVLRNRGPIQSVTSVTESFGTVVYTLNQTALTTPSADAYAYTVDLDAGVIVRRASGIAIPFANGIRNVHVTFVAGYATVPEDLKQACRILLKHLWAPRRAPRSSSAQPQQAPESGELPVEVQEILKRYASGVPGIA